VNEEPKNQVTISLGNDGFDDGNASDRLIQGVILKCVDGFWSAKDGTTIPPKTPMIALATTEAIQLWREQLPVETIIKQPGVPLPSVDELNGRIPEKTWEKGLDGNPRPPYSKQYVAYLLDPKDASVFTFINSTVGAEIAVNRLKERVRWMRALRGAKVVPVVELDTKPMKTKKGLKMRPDFHVVEWRDLGALQVATTVPAIEHMGKPVTEPSLKEEMRDEVPFNDPLPDLGVKK
jgi:hypothetical protein